jgi:hypothetical protein
MTRFLLCRPQAGLNDMLCQIEKCCRYAERTDRTVIVDTNYKYSSYFKDDLSRYLVSRQSRLCLCAEEFKDQLDQWQVFPESLSGRVNDYSVIRNEKSYVRYDAQSGVPVTFDFGQDYPHRLLVHHQGGGGDLSLFALLRMKIAPVIADQLTMRYRQIRPRYSAIHVRNTDLNTRYADALAKLKSSSTEPLFVATDNRTVVEEFRSALGDDRVFSFASLPTNAGQPIHIIEQPESHDEVFQRNSDAILDLLLLSLAQKLHLLEVYNNKHGKYSGFSVLAYNLWSSKIVLKHLIANSDVHFGLD